MKNLLLFEPELAQTQTVVSPVSDETKALYYALFNYLNHHGWKAERYNLGNHREAFAQNSQVNNLMKSNPKVLPILLLDNRVIHQGSYLTLEKLKALLHLEDDAIRFITAKAKQHIDEWNDTSEDHFKDCACI